ncbi:DNA polymerase zeta [Serendipita sp. 405]|nr:DNA polymerase zeta [Serendipita sp. 405]
MLKGPNFDPRRLRNHRLESFESELDIINALIDEVNHLDPDIICGWEVQSGSWGYLIARANIYGIDAKELLGRAPVKASGGGVNNWSTRHTSTIKVSGRHVLNIWRLMRSELTLDFYTFHNVARHVLKQRFPRYTNASLSEWFASGTPVENSRVISYYVDMASMLLEVLDEIQIVIKTAEFARVFGIDFFSVLSRGSQFKVESFMLRIAKPESFVLISPSRHQVGMQNAAECFPLIMEPISAFYKSPLLVLDFQSLYPSVMVAYNYCYSTCLGRVKDFKGKNKFGVLDDLEVPPGLLEKVKDHIHIAPNGMIYVKPTVRKSLLAKMLTELLDTRVMVKQGMQLAKGNKVSKPRFKGDYSSRDISLFYEFWMRVNFP